MGDDIFRHIACAFVLREDVDVPDSLAHCHRFTTISVRGPRGDGRLHCTVPPDVGDRVWLSANEKELTGDYKVIDRQWMHASWGSQIFPYSGVIEANHGVMLDLLVERAGPGWYATEVPADPEEEET